MPSQLQVWRQHGYKQVQQLKLCTYVTAEVPASLFWETENTIPTQGSCLLRIDSFQKKKKNPETLLQTLPPRSGMTVPISLEGRTKQKLLLPSSLAQIPIQIPALQRRKVSKMLFRTQKTAAAESIDSLLASGQRAADTLFSLCAASEPNCGPWTLGNQDFCYAELCVCPIRYQRWFTAWDALFLHIFPIELRTMVTCMRKNDGCRGLQRCRLVHEAQHSYDVLWWAHVPVLVSTRWPIFLQTLWRKGPAINAGSKAGPPAGYADDRVSLL